MDVPLVIPHHLKDLGRAQRGLEAAAQVTESYISQLQAGKKVPQLLNKGRAAVDNLCLWRVHTRLLGYGRQIRSQLEAAVSGKILR